MVAVEICSSVTLITSLVALYAGLSEVLPFLKFTKCNGVLHTLYIFLQSGKKKCIENDKQDQPV